MNPAQEQPPSQGPADTVNRPATLRRPGRWDGRALIALLLVAYFAVLFGAAKPGTWWQRWQRMGVVARPIPFSDLRILPVAAEGDRRGLNPYVDDIGDAWRRHLNYPRLWLRSYDLGLTMERIPMVGFALGGLTLAAVLFVVGPVGWGGGLLWAVLLCSPAVMLGVERANIDLFIFCLLALALALRRRPIASAALVLFAGVGKFFPLGGMLAFCRRPSYRVRVLIGVCVLVFTSYLAITFQDLLDLRKAMPHSVSYSYGCAILPGVLAVRLHSYLNFEPALLLGWLAVVLLLGLALHRGRNRLSPSNDRESHAFLLGAGCFMVSFAQGTSFDYRSIFLLLCVPLWLCLARGRDAVAASARQGLACLLLYLHWNLLAGEGSFIRLLCKQLLAWLILYKIALCAAGVLWGRRSSSANVRQ